MPYQPTSPYPYLETIDAAFDNTFSCAINPRDVIIKYELQIFDIRSTNDSPVLTVTETAEGRSYRGDSEIINTATVKSELQLPLRGTTNDGAVLKIPIPANYILNKYSENESTNDADKLYGDYIWNIKLFDNNGSVTSFDYFFKVRDTAFVTVKNDNTTLSQISVNEISSSSISINATYSQAQNILPSHYCFNLYLDNQIVYTTGTIISSNITFEYNSLISGKQYLLEMVLCDDDKNQFRYEYKISVLYNYYTSTVNPVIIPNNDKSFVTIDYSDNISIIGQYDTNGEIPTYRLYKKASDSTPATDVDYNAICIPNEQYVCWSENNNKTPLVLDDTEQVVHWHGHEHFDGLIMEKSDPQYTAGRFIIGHDVSSVVKHAANNLIYTDTEDSNMPIGISTQDIKGGFYYKLGTFEKVYISEFTKITSAIYKSSVAPADESNIQTNDETLYILNDDDNISDNNMLLENDIIYKYWWVVALLSSKAIVKRGDKYSDTVVNN